MREAGWNRNLKILCGSDRQWLSKARVVSLSRRTSRLPRIASSDTTSTSPRPCQQVQLF
jgi:hypothetical protein